MIDQRPPAARAVTFLNKGGQRLFGILHEPAGEPRDVAIVLLSAGVKARVGPHGLYKFMAERLCRAGFRVLRFDFAGLGDADGAIEAPQIADYYGTVSLGRYVDDTHAALEWASSELGVKRVILGGLCGGAITGLLAGAEHPNVTGLLALGLPVSVDGSNVDRVRFMSTGQLETVRDSYIDKLRDPKSWLRVLGMKTDFRLVLRSFFSSRRRAAAAAPGNAASPDDNTNPLFLPALQKMLHGGRPVIFLFSGADRLYWEFKERFVDTGRLRLQAFEQVLDIQVVEDANHVFGFREWQDDMLSRTLIWLDRQFDERGRAHDVAASGALQAR